MNNYVVDLEATEVDVKIKDFCERLNLSVVHCGNKETLHIATYHFSRPGLQLAGFYEHFSAERVQVMGEQEIAYLCSLDEKTRMERLDKFFSCDFPCLVLTRARILDEVLTMAKKYDRLVLESPLRTTGFVNELSIYLNEVLAPSVVMHGVLVDIYGVGVLIVGKSGVGKSENALELVQRGHRLVADDAVQIKRVSDRLIGSAPQTTRHFMEIRGIGIIDVKSMYGAGAIREEKVVDLVVQLEDWDETKNYDRYGDEEHYYDLLQMQLPLNVIPVKPGRNLSIILEVCAKNYRLKTMGIHALEELSKRLEEMQSTK